MFSERILAREATISLAINSPSSPIIKAALVDFPPGAAHISNTRIPFFKSAISPTNMALGS